MSSKAVAPRTYIQLHSWPTRILSCLSGTPIAGQRRAQALAAEAGERGLGRNTWLRRTGLENSVHRGSDFWIAPI